MWGQNSFAPREREPPSQVLCEILEMRPIKCTTVMSALPQKRKLELSREMSALCKADS